MRATDDNVQTPVSLARRLCAVLHPSGTILEPCAGDGAFVKALKPYGTVTWCEQDPARRYSTGQDFLTWTDHVDWIVMNPPWSHFRAFLAHSLQVADHVAVLSTLNHLWTRHRRSLVRNAGFGLAQIIEIDDVPDGWQKTGFQLGMTVLVRGFTGPCQITRLP